MPKPLLFMQNDYPIKTVKVQKLPVYALILKEKFFKFYYSLFSIREIEDSPVLQWLFGAVVLGFLVRFNEWSFGGRLPQPITKEAALQYSHLCWPYFPNCGDWYFLSSLPYGYSLKTLYTFFFLLILVSVYFMWKKNWTAAHASIMPLFLWKILVLFVLSMAYATNYDYYHVIIAAILLLFAYKTIFLRLALVVLYFLAATVKFHEGWILGTYFTALKTGLPIFPNILAPFITNMVILGETAVSWFLLSSNRILQRLALGYFTFFHLYSSAIVGYTYPLIVLPALLILFGPLYVPAKFYPPPFNRRSLPGWTLVAMLFAGQLMPVFIRGDTKLTLEGNFYGLFMFEANHQCVSTVTTYLKDGTKRSGRIESSDARNRCDPYGPWFRIHQYCLRNQSAVNRIEWQFDHSINGGPFYRIVDEKNACSLTYHALQHNEWIRLPQEGAPVIGYPVKDIYY